MTARLEARWGLQLSSALMQSVSDITEQALYQRAVEPFLRQSNVIDAEGEHVLESAWMVQELPTKRKSVLVVVTNHAVYTLTYPRGLLCNVCESWKLCPTGPRFLKRTAHYKINKLLLDYSAAHGAGHRFKLEFAAGHEKPSSPEGKAAAPPKDAQALALLKSQSKDLQFSSLHVGVAQRMLSAIHRVHPRGLPVTLDAALPRVLHAIKKRGKPGGASGILADASDMDAPPDDVLLCLRCEREGVKGAPSERLLVVTDHSVLLYIERPELFGLMPWNDLSSTDDLDQLDGTDFLRLDDDGEVVISDLDSLDLVMQSEPVARLSAVGSEPLSVAFADDTGAALFRQRMREVLNGKGHASWNDGTPTPTNLM